ncbi:AMP-binding protein [Paracoccus sp. (in: a-proteobacteria)]|uniref:AMP-binding protein n=1 Tax=Paracoccus sp. TaxID=267 RepID=UPI002AFF835E|nr:AMP-binding protein [Paracoccus sp. (in: a-proteobacteria)]
MMLEIDLEDRIVTRHLQLAAESCPDRVFLKFGADTHSFGAFDLACTRAANTLGKLGLERGGSLGIFARNSYAFVLSWFAATRLGALYVPINTEYQGEVLKYQLSNASVTHLLVDPDFLERLDTIATDLPLLRHIILPQDAEVPDGLRHRFDITTVEQLLLGSEASIDAGVGYADPIAISFTSGTTGPSKGVIATNAHVVNYALDWSNLMSYRPGEIIHTPLPLFHAIGAWMGVLPSLLYRNTISITPRFSASAYWQEVRDAKADIAHGIFSMVPILMKQPPRDDDAAQPARAFYNGNANPEFERRFKIQIIEAYGATETGIVAGTPFGELRKGQSCGKINGRSFEAMVADEHDRPLPAGQSGELLVRPRAPHVMFAGYHGKETATLEAMRNLWFHTGDRCRLDVDGHLYFLDRLRDTIRRRGENISSFELEYAINKHPDILECAAVPVASELGEFEVKIVVVLMEGAQMTAEAFWSFCIEALPRFWVPSYLEFRDVMPKTGTQKIQKFQLTRIGGDHDTYAREWKSGKITLIPRM